MRLSGAFQLGDLAAAHGEAARTAASKFVIVGDKDQRRAVVAIEREEELFNALARLGVEVARGLIGKEDFGIVNKGACEGDALLLATGQLDWVMIFAIGQAHLGQPLIGQRANAAFAAQLQRREHIFTRGEGRDKLKILKNEANVQVAIRRTVVLAHAVPSDALQLDLTGGWVVEPSAQAEQRGLAAARRANDGQRFPGVHGEAQPLENFQFAMARGIGFAHVDGLEHGRLVILIQIRHLTKVEHGSCYLQLMSTNSPMHRTPWTRALAFWFALALPFFAVEIHAKPQAVVFYGDSLTAAYGLAPEQGYPALIQEKIDDAGLADRFDVVASAVSGETSAGGLSRLNWAIAGLQRSQQDVGVFMLALGANDGLRGQPIDAMKRNLQAILDGVKERYPKAKLIVAGMLMPPNMGAEYRKEFAAAFGEVAEANDATLIPFLLEGVAGNRELNLPDGIHPNPKGQQKIADALWPVLEPILKDETKTAK